VRSCSNNKLERVINNKLERVISLSVDRSIATRQRGIPAPVGEARADLKKASSVSLVLGWRLKTQRKLELCTTILANLFFEQHPIITITAFRHNVGRDRQCTRRRRSES
jgi:hypothetical protein